MTQMENQASARIARNGYKVDVSRGERIGRVSSEWFNRPDDERYLSLTDLNNAVKRRSERSKTRIVESEAIRVEAPRDNPERLTLMLPDAHAPVAPTHWSFGQLASLVSAPATYLRQLPAMLAGINLQYGLSTHRAEQVKTLEIENGRLELRAVTGPDYGRIFDHELVEAVQKIAGNGTRCGTVTSRRSVCCGSCGISRFGSGPRGIQPKYFFTSCLAASVSKSPETTSVALFGR